MIGADDYVIFRAILTAQRLASFSGCQPSKFECWSIRRPLKLAASKQRLIFFSGCHAGPLGDHWRLLQISGRRFAARCLDAGYSARRGHRNRWAPSPPALVIVISC
jgi:hypothetical protein